MKKFILLICILSWSYYTNAQCDNTLPVYEDFSNSTEVNLCWTFIDADNDGWGWMNTDMGGGNKGLRSHSFIGYALSPNNWAISNAIDLTSANETLSWRVRATDWDFDKEKYTVYVATGNQISDFESSSLFLTENLDNTDASGQFASRSLDISSFAGQTVYVAFRHHNVSDQWSIDIDDFKVASDSSGGGGCTDSDGDGVCDSEDLCPGFDDTIDSDGDGVPDGCDICEGYDDHIDTNNNGIPDGCEVLATCVENTTNFNSSTLTHSGTGTNTSILTLPTDGQDISFTISGIDSKTKGKESDKFIERVKVTYKNGNGSIITNGTYRGDQVSSATISIPGYVQSITIILDDAYDGNSATTLSINLGQVNYCGSTSTPCTDSDGDGICDTEDKCPGFDDSIDSNGNGIPDGCESNCTTNIDNFNINPLTHSGTGSNSTTLVLPDYSQDISFVISSIDEKTKGKQSNQYIEHVVVSYEDDLGVSYTYGTFNGSSLNSATINIKGIIVKSITVNLSDGLTGNTTSNMSINLSEVTYCIDSSKSLARTSSSKYSTSQKVDESLSKFEEPVEDSFKIFPNPASGKLFIKSIGSNDSNKLITLYNMNGMQVRSYKLNKGYGQSLGEINIYGLSAGLYVLRIMSENGSLLKTERIIIK